MHTYLLGYVHSLYLKVSLEVIWQRAPVVDIRVVVHHKRTYVAGWKCKLRAVGVDFCAVNPANLFRLKRPTI